MPENSLNKSVSILNIGNFILLFLSIMSFIYYGISDYTKLKETALSNKEEITKLKRHHAMPYPFNTRGTK